jgi:hypothetical protein
MVFDVVSGHFPTCDISQKNFWYVVRFLGAQIKYEGERECLIKQK